MIMREEMIMITLPGRNCFIRNFESCFGDAPNVTSNPISCLADEMVSWMNNEKTNKANKSIVAPVIHDALTMVFTI
jgi:hypothetical protein